MISRRTGTELAIWPMEEYPRWRMRPTHLVCILAPGEGKEHFVLVDVAMGATRRVTLGIMPPPARACPVPTKDHAPALRRVAGVAAGNTDG